MNSDHQYHQLVHAETTAGAYVARPEFVAAEPSGYVGPVASPSAIIKRLSAAQDWLMLPPTVGMAGQRKRYAGTDDVIVGEIVVGCVGLLLQSPRSYAGWVAKHGQAVRELDRRAVRRLVSLTISDVSIAIEPLMVSYHFDQFLAGPLARETRERRAGMSAVRQVIPAC